MKASKELVTHISARFWDKSNKEVAQCLADFEGEWYEETPPVKHPIEQDKEQRDYTGMRFRHKDIKHQYFKLIKGKIDKYLCVDGVDENDGDAEYSQSLVEEYFTEGTWIEIPNEEKYQPKVGELVEIYGDNESDGGFKGEYSHTTQDGYHYIKTNDVIGAKNIRPVSNGVHVEQPKPEPTQRIESLEKSRKELFTNQSNIFSRLAHLESLELAHAIATLQDCVKDLYSREKSLEMQEATILKKNL